MENLWLIFYLCRLPNLPNVHEKLAFFTLIHILDTMWIPSCWCNVKIAKVSEIHPLLHKINRLEIDIFSTLSHICKAALTYITTTADHQDWDLILIVWTFNNIYIMCQTCQDISPLIFPHHHIYIWFHFLSQLLAKIQNLIPINEKWRRIKIMNASARFILLKDHLYRMVKEQVQQYLSKPNHCIWPIRTHYTFVLTNEQFAPNEDDLAMVQWPSTITIL